MGVALQGIRSSVLNNKVMDLGYITSRKELGNDL